MTVQFIRRSLGLWAINHIFCGTKFFAQKRALMHFAGFKVGSGTRIVGPIECTGKLSIGDNCWIGKELKIHGNGVVQIGDNCDIAPEVTFLTGGHQIGSNVRRAGVGESYTIKVGNGTWIGGRVTVLGDTVINDGSVIASCACVIRDIPSNTLVGGVPARKIREL